MDSGVEQQDDLNERNITITIIKIISECLLKEMFQLAVFLDGCGARVVFIKFYGVGHRWNGIRDRDYHACVVLLSPLIKIKYP